MKERAENANPGRLWQRALACLSCVLVLAGPAHATSVQYTPVTTTVRGRDITIYSKPADNSGSMRIANGTGGDLWFGEMALGTIVRFSPTGLATVYPVPISGASIHALAEGSNHKMWFADFNSGKVGFVTTKGRFKLFDTALSTIQSDQMVQGDDAGQWFVTNGAGIGRTSRSGKTTFFNLANNATQPTGLTVGPGNQIWFAEWIGPNVGYVDSGGTVHEFNAGFGSNSNTFGIALGSDGRMWFCDPQNRRISAINTNGTGLTFYSKKLTGLPDTIVAGPDGNLYFGEFNGAVGMITTAGAITEFPLPITEGNFPVLGMTVGPDNNIWFTNYDHAQIGQLKIPPPAAPSLRSPR